MFVKEPVGTSAFVTPVCHAIAKWLLAPQTIKNLHHPQSGWRRSVSRKAMDYGVRVYVAILLMPLWVAFNVIKRDADTPVLEIVNVAVVLP